MSYTVCLGAITGSLVIRDGYPFPVSQGGVLVTSDTTRLLDQEASITGSRTGSSGAARFKGTNDDSVCLVCGVSNKACQASSWSTWHLQCSKDPTLTVYDTGLVFADTPSLLLSHIHEQCEFHSIAFHESLKLG